MVKVEQAVITVHEDAVPDPGVIKITTQGTIADVKRFATRNARRNQFRPRVGKGGTTSYQLRQYAEVTLGGGSLRKVVKLPEGEDENEWLAVNSMYRTVTFWRTPS